jgi:hypothetical protein
MFRGVSVANEQFRRNAAAVWACAAEGAAFYKRDFDSGRAAFDGRGNRVSAAKDNEIEMFVFHARFIAVAPLPYKRIELCGQE